MPGEKGRPPLSAGEMRLMALLWDRGPMTLAEVHEAQGRDVAQTTIQNQLTRLVDKQVVSRSAERPARFAATVDPPQATRGFLDLLVETVGQGRISPLVAQLVARAKLSAAEITELHAIIDRAEVRSKSARNRK